MWMRNRSLTVFTAASYLLAVTASALFHHHDGHEEEPSRPGASASHYGESEDCSVCQFLAQKPVPVVIAAAVTPPTPVAEVAAQPPVRVVGGVLIRWRSRAPPLPA
jgi:hypothetical protein